LFRAPGHILRRGAANAPHGEPKLALIQNTAKWLMPMVYYPVCHGFISGFAPKYLTN